MAKKKKRNLSVFLSLEGVSREKAFFMYLYELYDPVSNNIRIKEGVNYGGTSSAVLLQAIKNSFHEKVYAWFDADDILDCEIRERLAKDWCVEPFDEDCIDADLQKNYNSKLRKPILIVSNPVCVEGLLLRILGKETAIPDLNCSQEEQKRRLKSAFCGVLSCSRNDFEKEKQYYRDNLSLVILNDRRKKIPELDLLMSIFEKS